MKFTRTEAGPSSRTQITPLQPHRERHRPAVGHGQAAWQENRRKHDLGQETASLRPSSEEGEAIYSSIT